MVGVGALFGGMTGGIFSDWLLTRTWNRRLARQGIAFIGMLSCGGLIAVSYFISDATIAIACVSLGAFLATFGGVSGYTMAIEFGGKHVATTFSIMNKCGNIGAALFPLLAGYISDGTSGLLAEIESLQLSSNAKRAAAAPPVRLLALLAIELVGATVIIFRLFS